MNRLNGLWLAGLASVALLAGTASADIYNGAGGAIPGSGTGGGGSWTTAGGATVLPTAPSNFSINIPTGVASVNSITFLGLSHTFIGDLHAVLVAPDGSAHNIFVRPGLFATSTFGNGGDFLGGDYTFIESGAANDLPVTSTLVVNPAPGTYNQTFAGSANAAAQWVDGNLGISNTPLSSISGNAGVWTLRIYDWAGGDTGSLQGWSIDVSPVPAPGALALLGLAGLVGGHRRRN